MDHDIAVAFVLNLHQPSGNLEDLLESQPWEAKQILWALDRIPRSLWAHEHIGRVHLSLSGTLLETLSSPAFQERVYGIVDCGSLLWHLQNTSVIDILGTGYYHPVLPLIPGSDREEQVARWLGIGRHLFARQTFSGFWPPEMGFCMELIPLLRRWGYRYVLVDSEHVRPVSPMSWQETRYQPHVARYRGQELTIVVRDRELSDAQESGMDTEWYLREVRERTRWCDFLPLVTTCTDGDNGGWFRQTTPGGNFWSAFHDSLMARVASGDSCGIRPCFIDDYLDRHPATGEVVVGTGAWNTGWHHGRDFTQWRGSDAQRRALVAIGEISAALAAVESGDCAAGADDAVEEARWHLLRAETSCNLYWGQAWVDRCERDLDVARKIMEALPTG